MTTFDSPHRPALFATLLASATCAGPVLAQSTGHPCSDWAEAVAVDREARTLVGGSAADNRILEWPEGHAHFGALALARLLPDGSPDVAFGDGGSLIVDAGDFATISAASPVYGGAIAAGTTAQRDGAKTGPKDLLVLRVDEVGARVGDFGEAGLARFDLGGSVSVAAISPAWWGSVYVAGTLTREGAPSEGFVAHVGASGELDTGFGDGGVVRFALEGRSVRFFGVRALWDGVAAGGQATREGDAIALVVRLDGQGRFREDFGEAGYAHTHLSGTLGGDGAAAISASGAAHIALALTGADGATRIANVRFDRDGAEDEGASTVLDVPGGAADSVYAAAIRRSSVILAGTTSDDDSASDGFVARLGRDGALDPAFGVRRAHFDLEYTAFLGSAMSATGVTLAGYDFGEAPASLPPSDALVVRYRADGTLDPTFGEGGVVKLDFRQGALACGPRVDVGAGPDEEHAD